jgi:excisionase family DNA binding protein
MALLSVEDLERDSKISRFTWRAWIRQGRLPVIRAGRRVRVEENAYRAFLDKCRVPARDDVRP